MDKVQTVFEKFAMPLSLGTSKKLVKYLKSKKIPIIDISSQRRIDLTLKRSGLTRGHLPEKFKEDIPLLTKAFKNNAGTVTNLKKYYGDKIKGGSNQTIVYNKIGKGKSKNLTLMNVLGHETGHLIDPVIKNNLNWQKSKTLAIRAEFQANRNFRDKLLPKFTNKKKLTAETLQYQKDSEFAVQQSRRSLLPGFQRRFSSNKFNTSFANKNLNKKSKFPSNPFKSKNSRSKNRLARRKKYFDRMHNRDLRLNRAVPKTYGFNTKVTKIPSNFKTFLYRKNAFGE